MYMIMDIFRCSINGGTLIAGWFIIENLIACIIYNMMILYVYVVYIYIYIIHTILCI